eukprot:m.919899 g.919899  ORF g.919899 m.919899 type:complete len:439 (+) comp23754_c0_seq19:102-1418(+)
MWHAEAHKMNCPLKLLHIIGLSLFAFASGSSDIDYIAAIASRCPRPTFATPGPTGELVCACPHAFKCEGCSLICKNQRQKPLAPGEALGPPVRCVQGFVPSCGPACQCIWPENDGHTSTPAAGPVITKQSMCGSAANSHAVQQARGDPWTPELKTKFIFTISNGHAATSYLGKRKTWENFVHPRTLNQSLRITFEGFPYNLAIRQLPMHPNTCAISMFYMNTYWWDGFMKDVMRKSPWVSTWFDTGHLASMVAGTLASVFGPDRVSFLRVRRNRLDLAYSKYVSVSHRGLTDQEDDYTLGPCSTACEWCLCPLDAATVCLPPGDVWAELTPFQKFLWEIDEVECVWRALQQEHPNIDVLEIDWDQHLTADAMARIAAFAGMPARSDGNYTRVPLAERNNQHVNTTHRRRKNTTLLHAQDMHYRSLLRPVACTAYTCTF